MKNNENTKKWLLLQVFSLKAGSSITTCIIYIYTYILAWDVMCWDTFAPSYISCVASEVARIANQAETRKITVYHEIAQSHIFTPIGF